MSTKRPLLSSSILGLLLTGCAAAATPSASPTLGPPSPSPAASPSPSAAFELAASPPDEPRESRLAIPGSPYCFLVDIEDTSASGLSVTIEAKAELATVADIRPVLLTPGTIGEVCVIADPTEIEMTGSVVITASRDGTTKTATRSLPVFPMADERARPPRRGGRIRKGRMALISCARSRASSSQTSSPRPCRRRGASTCRPRGCCACWPDSGGHSS